MSTRVLPLSPFEGEDARGLVGDFGPFGIEMVSFQVLREQRRWWGGKRPTWITVKSTFFDWEEGYQKGYDIDQWTTAQLDFLRAWIEEDLAKARAREAFYAKD